MAAVNSVALITQAEYARRRGVAKSAVHKAVAEGRISLIDGRIDPHVADIQWERNTRARADAGQASALVPSVGATSPAADASPPPLPEATGYAFDRALRERAEREMAEIALAKEKRQLVHYTEVRAEMAARIGDVRTNLLQIPARLAPLLAPETDQGKVHALIDAELRAVLTKLTT